jgi:hypothetical protein
MKIEKRKRGRPKSLTPKEVVLSLKITRDEDEALKVLAEQTDSVSVSDVLRNMIGHGAIHLMYNGEHKTAYRKFLRQFDTHSEIRELLKNPPQFKPNC